MEESRLDAKIQSKLLLQDKIDDFWESIWEAVKKTADSLNKHFGGQVTSVLNDNNTAIKIGLPFNAATHEKRSAEIRFKREDRKVVLKSSANPDKGQWDKPVCFLIKADRETRKLYLQKGTEPVSAIHFAEWVVAEQLMGLDLSDTGSGSI